MHLQPKISYVSITKKENLLELKKKSVSMSLLSVTIEYGFAGPHQLNFPLMRL